MKIWICDGCSAEIKEKPESCPICGRTQFTEEHLKEEKLDSEDKKHSKKYEKIVEELEDYSEDCEPEQAKYSYDD
jgi:rubrerythrin